jgi:AraC family transcriptional regulator
MNLENLTQIERYKNLIKFIDKNFKENIDIGKIEEISHYSYRNINRIFHSLQQETIGKYIKRIRLEKSAEYLKYTNQQISDIAINVGFTNVASFSKAFKKRFNCSPISFRKTVAINQKIHREVIENTKQDTISFSTKTLPTFEILYLEHKGNYDNIKAIEKTWNTFINYCDKKQLISDESIFFSETLDDNKITDNFQCRTNVALILRKPIDFIPEGLFQKKTHKEQKYTKFIHNGFSEKLEDTYSNIYSSWLTNVSLEFADKPILEFYINHHEKIPAKDFITEIYIPVK